MSTLNQRVLIVHDGSSKLCVVCMSHVISVLSLRRGSTIRILGINEAFTMKGCAPWYCIGSNKKLHSSATISNHKKNIEEETQNAQRRYLKSPEYKDMQKIASTYQVEFEVAMEAGLLREVAVESAKRFRATCVILHRLPKKELKYFTQNLSCEVYRMPPKKFKILTPPQADEVCSDPPGDTSDPETGAPCEAAPNDPICSTCGDKRPWIRLRGKFPYSELQLATNHFCPQSLVPDHGKNIYLGLLKDQRKALIREIPSDTIKEEQFKRELKLLEDVGHENVALLVGMCSEGPRRFLVYEYICNGSLNKLLSEKSQELTWERRIAVAYGAAKGLEYLHRKKIYGSIKPSNILITHDYHPLISYYGLTMNQYEVLGRSFDTTTLRPFEYLAPEYQETGIDLSAAEVYSFGVVLLELITGRKTKHDTSGESFLRWARPLLRDRKYMELIDPVVEDTVDIFQLYWLVHVAYKCLSWEPNDRYSMKKVVEALSSILNHSGVEDISLTESEW